MPAFTTTPVTRTYATARYYKRARIRSAGNNRALLGLTVVTSTKHPQGGAPARAVERRRSAVVRGPSPLLLRLKPSCSAALPCRLQQTTRLPLVVLQRNHGTNAAPAQDPLRFVLFQLLSTCYTSLSHIHHCTSHITSPRPPLHSSLPSASFTKIPDFSCVIAASQTQVTEALRQTLNPILHISSSGHIYNRLSRQLYCLGVEGYCSGGNPRKLHSVWITS